MKRPFAMTLLGRFSRVLTTTLVAGLVLILSGVAEAGRVTTSRFVVARSRASMSAAPVGRVAAGVSVNVVRKQGAWALVRWGGNQGWIRTSALEGASQDEASPFARRGIKAKSDASERKLSKQDASDDEGDAEAEEDDAPVAKAKAKSGKKLTKKEQLALERAEALARAKKLAQARAKALADAEAQALAEAEDIKRQMNESEDEESEDEEEAAPRKKGTAKVKSSERSSMAASSERTSKKGWGKGKSKMAPADEEEEDDEESASADEGEDEDLSRLDDEEAPIEKGAKKIDKKAAAKAKAAAAKKQREEAAAAAKEEREERAAKAKAKKKAKREAAFAADDAAGDISDEDAESADEDDDEAPSSRVRKRGSVDRGRKGLRFAVGSDLGYQVIQHQFVSDARADGANFLPNYSLAAGVASFGIGGRVTYPVGKMRAGLSARYAYGYSSGLKVPVPDGSETLAMSTQMLELNGTVAYPVMKGRLALGGAVGYGRYGTTIADGQRAVLPSEVISGILVGLGADAPDLFAKIGLRAHAEAMPYAGIAQNRGREEGAAAKTLGAGAGLQLYRPIAMKGHLKAQLGYDFRYTFTEFSGNGNRVQSTRAQRAMASHAIVLGVGWDL